MTNAPNRRIRLGAPSIGLLLAALVATPASAQDREPTAADVAIARDLGQEGVRLADEGNCSAALDKLSRAEAIYHAPSILVRLGECQVAIGKVVAGTESLQRVVREQLPAKSPPAFVAAQARARKALEGAMPKIARLRIHLENGQVPNLLVKIDGEPIPLATLDVDRPTDPGAHQVEISAPGYKPVGSVVSLPEGGSAAVTLKLDPDANAAPAVGAAPAVMAPTQPAASPPGAYGAPPPAGVPAPGADSATTSSQGGTRSAAFVLLGVGGAGVIVGSVTGVMALGKKSSVDDGCQNKAACPVTSQDDIDSMKTLATVSTVGFVIGALAVGAGGILLLTGKHSAADHAAKPAPAGRVAVEPWIGLGSAGVTGAF